jgi:hypothetical protein
MPRKRQIPYLDDSRRTKDGRTIYDWNPSPRLRRLGHKRIIIGPVDLATACKRAIEINETLTEAQLPAPAARPVAPFTFRELSRRFQESGDFPPAESSRKEYRSRLNFLERWLTLKNGESVPVRAISEEIVQDLRNELVADGRRHRTAGILRVLRIVLGYARRQRFIAANPTAQDLRIPEPGKRRHRFFHDDIPWLERAAGLLHHEHVKLASVLGFYTMQREADILATTRFRMSPIRDISAEARRALAGADGHVLGITLIQEKTDVPVAIPLAPLARTAIETCLRGRKSGGVEGTYLIKDPNKPDAREECAEWRLQRDFRETRELAAKLAMQAAEDARLLQNHDEADALEQLAARLRKGQYRDLRRSGMCWMRDLGVSIALIAAISGHSIEQTQKILDTYLPRDTRAAAEGMAIAVSRQAERDAEDALEESKG